MSRSTIASLANLLPSPEYDVWIREMTSAGLDFRNPEGSCTLDCFKKVCTIERNINENYRETSASAPSSSTSSRKGVQPSNHLLLEKDKKIQAQEVCVRTVKNSIASINSNRNSLPKWKFPCPVINHDHKIKKCKEFFDMSPRERWEK